MKKLLLYYNDQSQISLQNLLNQMENRLIKIDKTYLFCTSEEVLKIPSSCIGLVEKVIIRDTMNFHMQKEELQDFLKDHINEFDQLYIYLFNHASSPLQHVLMQICGSLYQYQTTYIEQSSHSVVPMIEKEEVGANNILQHMRELIYSGNYRSALNYLHKRKISKKLRQLIQFGDNLFRMDFSFQIQQSQKHPLDLLVDTITCHELGFGEEIKYLQDLKKVQTGDQRAFIYFLHNYAEFLYEQNDIIDFIVIFYRIAEESLLYSLGWDVNDDNRFTTRQEAEYKLDLPKWNLTKHLHRYEKALSQYIRGLEEKNKVKIRADKQVGLDKLTSSEQYFVGLYLFFKHKGIKECLDFRHEGISGHGFADLTKEELQTLCGGAHPLQLLEPLLEKQGLRPPSSLIVILNKAIIALLHEELEEIQY